MTIYYDFGDDCFPFEPDYKVLTKKVIELLVDKARLELKDMFDLECVTAMATMIVKDMDFEDDFIEVFEDELKEEFEYDAECEYLHACDLEREEQDWYGTKGDFYDD